MPNTNFVRKTTDGEINIKGIITQELIETGKGFFVLRKFFTAETVKKGEHILDRETQSDYVIAGLKENWWLKQFVNFECQLSCSSFDSTSTA